MRMSDDVEMPLKDGRTLLMKSKRIWVQIGPPGQSTTVRITE
jgi:hypothetical protein